MAGIASFSSVGSGIDFSVIRDAILSERTRPVTALQQKAGSYTNRVGALTQLNAALATLTTAAQALTSRDLGTGRSTTTTDATVTNAAATGTADLGNYEISITRLATSLSQASRSYSSTATPVLAGGATTATFSFIKGGTDDGISITIDSTNNTLAGLRDAINGKNAGVTASIIDVTGDGTGQQLVLSSTASGASSRVELVETTSTGTLADLNIRSLNPPDGDFTKLDAALTVNGLAITRSTNAVSDAVTGLTFNLKKVGTSTVGVTQSTEIENKLRGFINAYNAVQSFVAGQYTKDSRNRPTGILAGDSTLRNVNLQLREAIGAISANNGGTFSSLADIGITKDETGALVLDSTAFNVLLKSSPDDVKSLLFGTSDSQPGIFQSFSESSSGLSDNVTGSVQTAISGYQNSLKNLNDSIADRLEALARLKNSLTQQFSIADAAIGQLNGQGTALGSIIKSLTPTTSN